jgi:beta-lactamase class A
MTRTLSGTILLACLSLGFGCQSSSDLQKLESAISKEFQQTPGTFAVAWKNLNTGEELLINQDTVFHAASTMKTPVMIEIYKQSAEGRFHLTDSLLVKNEFYSIVDSSVFGLTVGDDSDDLLYRQIGRNQTIYDLVSQMIQVSSNLATNILIDLVDARKVTQTMRSLGATQIEVLRGVEDHKAYEADLNNTTTAFDLLVIYEHLATGTLIDATANRAMLQILHGQKFKDIIPAHLPDEVKVAHKTGSITGVHHDSGIVFLPDGRKYVLVLLSKNLEDFDQGTNTLAKISRLIYDYVLVSA